MALPPIPQRDDLIKLAWAALSNSRDLLTDARLLADRGSYPRAYALAALACEELGKVDLCLATAWLPMTPSAFWSSFRNHRGKLSRAYGDFAAESVETITSSDQFNQRVHHGSQAAHQRKLRG